MKTYSKIKREIYFTSFEKIKYYFNRVFFIVYLKYLFSIVFNYIIVYLIVYLMYILL